MDKVTAIKPIRTEEHYDHMCALLDTLWEQTQGDEQHPLWDICELVGDLVNDYEAKNHQLPESTGIQALRFLMLEHGIRQEDLPEIGSQGVVSEILSGKRELNIQQLKALANRFGLSVDTFV